MYRDLNKTAKKEEKKTAGIKDGKKKDGEKEEKTRQNNRDRVIKPQGEIFNFSRNIQLGPTLSANQ